MADALLKKKYRDWTKSYTTIQEGFNQKLSDEEKKAFLWVVQTIVNTGYDNNREYDSEQLKQLTDYLLNQNADRLQDSFSAAVNTFVSVTGYLDGKQQSNKNTWYDLYDFAKETGINLPAPTAAGQPMPGEEPEPEEYVTEEEDFVPEETPDTPYTPEPKPTSPKPAPADPGPRPERKKEHFSFKTLFGLILAYGGTWLLGFLPFLIGRLAVYLFDTGHWFFGILAVLGAIASIGVAWYGWIAMAALLIPIWICTTSWWWLGALILLFEAFAVYGMCLDTDD